MYKKKGYKYNEASAELILYEMEELCSALEEGSVEERYLAKEFKELIWKLERYYKGQGWI